MAELIDLMNNPIAEKQRLDEEADRAGNLVAIGRYREATGCFKDAFCDAMIVGNKSATDQRATGMNFGQACANPAPKKRKKTGIAFYNRAQVLEVIVITVLKTISNYTNHLTQPPLDAAFAGQKWTRPN